MIIFLHDFGIPVLVAIFVAAIVWAVTHRKFARTAKVIAFFTALAAFGISYGLKRSTAKPTVTLPMINNGPVTQPTVTASPSGGIKAIDTTCGANNSGNGSSVSVTCGAAPSQPKSSSPRRKK